MWLPTMSIDEGYFDYYPIETSSSEARIFCNVTNGVGIFSVSGARR